jgi:hypothetical protein
MCGVFLCIENGLSPWGSGTFLPVLKLRALDSPISVWLPHQGSGSLAAEGPNETNAETMSNGFRTLAILRSLSTQSNSGKVPQWPIQNSTLVLPRSDCPPEYDSESSRRSFWSLLRLDSLQPRAALFESSIGCLRPISFLYNSYLLSDKSTNSGFQGLCRRSSRAIVTGRSKRRGPALPGFT